MTIRKGDRFRVRGGDVYEVVQIGTVPSYFSQSERRRYRPINLRNLSTRRRMNRTYHNAMRQIQDHRWKLLDRFPALLRLPAGV